MDNFVDDFKKNDASKYNSISFGNGADGGYSVYIGKFPHNSIHSFYVRWYTFWIFIISHIYDHPCVLEFLFFQLIVRMIIAIIANYFFIYTFKCYVRCFHLTLGRSILSHWQPTNRNSFAWNIRPSWVPPCACFYISEVYIIIECFAILW